MNTKYKILIVLVMLVLFTSFYGLAYSLFNSDAILDSDGKNIAKFIFNTESLDEFQLALTDLKPGDIKEYEFAVSNNASGESSDVSIEYQMTIKTYHFIPLVIGLYRLDGENEELVLTCDETYSRNLENEIVCDTPMQNMVYSSSDIHDYKLKVEFPNQYNDVSYSDLVDYINIEIQSWQKIQD